MNQDAFALLLQGAIKGSLLIVLAWGAAHLCRKQSAAIRHMIWSTAMLSALALPLVMALLPGWESRMLADASTATRSGRAVTQPDSSLPAMVINAGVDAVSGLSMASWLFYVWLAGSLCGAVVLASGIVRLLWTVHRAQPLLAPEWMQTAAELTAQFRLPRPVRLRVSRDALMPLTWGYFRPQVLLPAEAESWCSARIYITLAHEFAHIQRRDWLLQMIAETGRTLYWFNPLVWLGCRRLRQESEQACDDAVLLSGITAPDYADTLLQLARTLRSSERPWAVSLAMAHPSHLERRFAAMFNPVLQRTQATRTAWFLTTLASACLLVPLAAMRAPAQTLAGPFFGTVYDVSGASVPNATVIASHPQARTKDMTVTNAAGVFSFPALPSGEYSLEALKPGFARLVMPVRLESGQSKTQNLTLQLGAVNEQVDVIAQGVSKEPATQTPAEPDRLRIGGNVQATKLVQKVQPPYPLAAKAAGSSGSVLLAAIIGVEGNLLSLRVLNSQIDPELARAAVEAVSQWRYEPTLLNGNPVEVLTNITVNFTLSR